MVSTAQRRVLQGASPRCAGMRQLPLLLLMMMMAALLLLSGTASASLIERSTFTAPFLSHDHRGNRIIAHWDLGGTAVVKQSFLRLTPDKPDNAGFVKARAALGPITEFSFITKLRMSGRSEKKFGDSFGIFITADSGGAQPGMKQNPPSLLQNTESGSIFGVNPNFIGLGVVIDFVKDGSDGGAPMPKGVREFKDVKLITNNGRTGKEQVLSSMGGCTGNFRFYEKRDDFNVLKSSRIRANYENGVLRVEVDARNTGRWRKCDSINVAEMMPEDWLKTAKVHLVANNAIYSDNHDVLSFRMFDRGHDAWAEDEADDASADDEDDFLVLIHHMEHELYSVHDSLASTITRLQEQERAAEERINQLEGQLSEEVLGQLADRLGSLENRVKGQMDSTMNRRMSIMENRMDTKITDTVVMGVGEASKTWRGPFAILIVLLLLLVFGAYRQYRALRKMHLL